MWGTVMGWHVAVNQTFLPFRIVTAGIGTLFGGPITVPFVVTNFASAYLALALTREEPFALQFAAFAAISLLSGTIVLKWLDQGLAGVGGLHLDQRVMAWALAMAGATFVLALLLMRFAPTHRPG